MTKHYLEIHLESFFENNFDFLVTDIEWNVLNILQLTLIMMQELVLNKR